MILNPSKTPTLMFFFSATNHFPQSGASQPWVSGQGIESTTGSSGLSTTVAVKTYVDGTVKGKREEENLHKMGPKTSYKQGYNPTVSRL